MVSGVGMAGWIGRLALIGAAVLAGLASPVLANSIRITARGTVPGNCSVTLNSNFPAARLATSGSVAASARVNCNTGFAVKATSANGAIRNARPAPAGFVNTVDYNLAVVVPLDNGRQIAATCPARQLLAGQSGCALSPAGLGLRSGGIGATNKIATLTALWTAPPPPKRLIAGTYSDTITLSVAAVP